MWVVYYPDEEVEGTIPWHIRCTDVQGILYFTDDWLFMSGYNYYVWRDDRWFGMETFDAVILYLTEPGQKKVLFTKEIDDDLYNSVVKKAMDRRQELKKRDG